MSGILNTIQDVAGKLGKTFQSVLDMTFPPEKRAEVLSKLQEFAVNNPKLAAFLTTQIAFTGIPILLFFTFGLTVFLFSLITALLIGLIAALLFTVLMLGVALVVVLPTVFLTTFAASFVFLWGLGGYCLMKWLNEGDASAPQGSAIGDKLNNLTGGRMGWLIEGARKKKDGKHTGVDQTPKTNGSESDIAPSKSSQSNGHANGDDAKMPPKLASKHEDTAKGSGTELFDGAQRRATKSTGGATSGTGTPNGTYSSTTAT